MRIRKSASRSGGVSVRHFHQKAARAGHVRKLQLLLHHSLERRPILQRQYCRLKGLRAGQGDGVGAADTQYTADGTHALHIVHPP